MVRAMPAVIKSLPAARRIETHSEMEGAVEVQEGANKHDLRDGEARTRG